MLQLLLASLLLSSCSIGVTKKGGKKSYTYNPAIEYQLSEISSDASDIVETSYRDPKFGTLKDLFASNQKPLKRVGIIIFESVVQPTRGGLSGQDLIYVSAQGKQLMTERFLQVWEQSFSILGSDVDFVTTAKIKKAKAFAQYGLDQENFINSKRVGLAPDDIFYIEPGKKTTIETTLNPRGMRDMSFLLVPANELMGGPKWSEQNKQFVNDLSKELNLDAVIIVMSEVSWTAAHTDKSTGDSIPEEMTIKISSSTLLSLTEYNKRLQKTGYNDPADINLCYRTYKGELKVPIHISLPTSDLNFNSIEKELLGPLFKTYKDLSQMTIVNIVNDLKKTW